MSKYSALLLLLVLTSVIGNLVLWKQNSALQTQHANLSEELKKLENSPERRSTNFDATLGVQAPNNNSTTIDAGILPETNYKLAELIKNKKYAQASELLQEQSLPEDVVRLYIATQIDIDIHNQNKEDGNNYWVSFSEDAINAALKSFEQAEVKRNTLKAIFGDSIENDPNFEKLFKPYQKRLNFLSSEQQLKIYEIKFKSALAQRSGNVPVSEEQQIESLLGSEDYYEYNLRNSRMSKLLARDLEGFEYSEEDFRALYQIKSDATANSYTDNPNKMYNDIPNLAGNNLNQLSQSSAEEENIKAYLGDKRYQEYSRIKQPNYKRTQKITSQYGYNDEDAMSAYDIIAESSNKLTSLLQDATLSPNERNIKTQDILMQAKIALETVVDPSVAHEVVEATLLGPKRF